MKTRMVLFLVLICAGCASREGIQTGSMISREGRITDESTAYTFSGLRGDRRVRDLFNEIYFKGDMLCFSLPGMDDVPENGVTVTFVHPPSGRFLGAERIEKSGSRIWGFSLVGSLLEAFFRDELACPAGGWKERDTDISVLVRASYRHENTTVTREKKLIFVVHY